MGIFFNVFLFTIIFWVLQVLHSCLSSWKYFFLFEYSDFCYIVAATFFSSMIVASRTCSLWFCLLDLMKDLVRETNSFIDFFISRNSKNRLYILLFMYFLFGPKSKETFSSWKQMFLLLYPFTQLTQVPHSFNFFAKIFHFRESQFLLKTENLATWEVSHFFIEFTNLQVEFNLSKIKAKLFIGWFWGQFRFLAFCNPTSRRIFGFTRHEKIDGEI
jgi:hypothetical protein